MYSSIADILEQSAGNQKAFWETVMEADMESRGVKQGESRREMKQMLDAMKAADRAYDRDRKSASGLSGGDGRLLEAYNRAGKNLCGGFLGKVMERAVKMGESNACMRRIVAAPTAGSCGVIPAVLLSYEEYARVPEDELMNALYVAAGIGKVIGENASIAGASGGCQAEIGTASAMAAAALAYLQGGDNAAIANAMALALKNLLGLACDPVGGLVEVPCVKRNSLGAVNAVASAQMALAGVQSAITPDDVIDSMRRIGNEMPASLKETGKGGLAASESARRLCGSAAVCFGA